MYFVGVNVTDEALAQGSELFARFAQTEQLDKYRAAAEVKQIRHYVDTAGPEHVGQLTVFAQQLSEAYKTGNPVQYGPREYGGCVAIVGMSVLRHNREIGSRLLHYVLTDDDTKVAKGSWSAVSSHFNDGKLSFEHYLPFFIIYTLRKFEV